MSGLSEVDKEVHKPSDDDIRLQLDRILSSENFRLPKRATCFLRYVIDEALAGRADHLKAYTIAEVVFKRRNFDPQNDPAVRIEARRIRCELERYYLLSHSQEPVIISIPKGGYAPTFRFSPSLPPSHEAKSFLAVSSISSGIRRTTVMVVAASLMVASAALSLQTLFPISPSSLKAVSPRPRLVIGAFDKAADSIQADALARAVRDEVIVKLVASGKMSVAVEPRPVDLRVEAYVLQGSVTTGGDMVRLSARLIRGSDSIVLWSDGYNLDPGSDRSWRSAEAVASAVVHGIDASTIMVSRQDRPPRRPLWDAWSTGGRGDEPKVAINDSSLSVNR